MPLIRLNRNPSSRQLTVFSMAWLIVAGAFGWAAWRHGHPARAAACWAAALAVPLARLVDRRPAKWAYVGLSYATYPIGWLVSHAVLAVVYFGVVTPLGLVMRLFGRDPLRRRFEARLPSYWTPREPHRPPASYFRQN